MAKNQPVDMIAVDHFRLESADGSAQTVEKGTLVTGVDAELALILAGSAKARPATPEEIAAARKPKGKAE